MSKLEAQKNAEISELMEALKPGDQVEFTEIFISNIQSGAVRKIKPAIFTLY